jgi:hypothetical protein|eukprot:Tamp_12030.p2 GENE.Tamp_12030~~Tamp_12030.p2  ORF type:complete len:286 (+),score=66.38 Tamp_12030:464-1321(+)
MRSGLGSVGADSPRNGRAYGANGEDGYGSERASVQELLALVEAERNKMSKAVLSSADGLSSAVTMARKRLAANILAVEEQLREEKRMLELARGEQPLTASTASTAELQALLHARDTELETLRRQKHALEEERDDLKKDLAAVKKELLDAKQRTTAAVESSAALQAEVNVLRGNLKGTETLALPLPVPGARLHAVVTRFLSSLQQPLVSHAGPRKIRSRTASDASEHALRMRAAVPVLHVRAARCALIAVSENSAAQRLRPRQRRRSRRQRQRRPRRTRRRRRRWW